MKEIPHIQFFKSSKQTDKEKFKESIKKKGKKFNGHKCSRYPTHEFLYVSSSWILSSTAYCVEDFELLRMLQMLQPQHSTPRSSCLVP